MLPFDVAVTFFAAAVVLALAPGPDNIFVLTQSALWGRQAGILVTLGLCTGLMGHTVAVVAGVAALIQASALAFSALKLVGAAYLLYLAWQAFRSAGGALESEAQPRLNGWQLYRRGILMNITNPKVSIFCLAFLPQFADPVRGSVAMQVLLLGGLFILSTLLVFGGVAMTAGALGPWLQRSQRVQRHMNRLAGTIFAALALKLVTAQR
ncbi:MAG: LysE family translocator [Desulfosarcinaceae bacterium]|nr:LysE family translocator [Desulfosarcinaceae bacterium]